MPRCLQSIQSLYSIHRYTSLYIAIHIQHYTAYTLYIAIHSPSAPDSTGQHRTAPDSTVFLCESYSQCPVNWQRRSRRTDRTPDRITTEAPTELRQSSTEASTVLDRYRQRPTDRQTDRPTESRQTDRGRQVQRVVTVRIGRQRPTEADRGPTVVNRQSPDRVPTEPRQSPDRARQSPTDRQPGLKWETRHNIKRKCSPSDSTCYI